MITNRNQQEEALKHVIQQLHEGKTVEEVQEEFATLIEDVGAMDIAELEQALIQEGMPESEIQRLCDVHVAVFRESLEREVRPDTTPGHPIHTFLSENAAAGRVLNLLEEALNVVKDEPTAEHLAQARERLEELLQYEKHYLRKENVLFPYLEKHGFSGPTTVMWGIHDEIREGWRKLGALLSEGPQTDPEASGTEIDDIFDPLATAIREIFYKEENILYPAALERLSGEEWWEIRMQSPDIGYCYVKAGDQWPPKQTALETAGALDRGEAPRSSRGLLHLDTGSLTPEDVNLLLSHLPVEISFVDANDEVRFFSQAGERIFTRSPAVIGRKVQKCHPPASVHRVEQILDDFRAARRDVAEFWIQMEERFIHIRYFAMRDEEGDYRGTVEVVQDVTHIRELAGERRLLD